MIKNSLEIRRVAGETVVTGSMLLNNLDFVIDKYQAGVISTTCYWPTDVISD